MIQANGYIQIEFHGKQAYCHLYPFKSGGKMMRIADMEEYLRVHGLTDYDKKEFREACERNMEVVLSMGYSDGIEFGESMNIKVSLDKMKVTCTFMPPSLKGPRMNVRDVMESLKMKGVVHGISQEAILDFINNPCYNTEYVFAEGTIPTMGQDGKVEYFFNTNHTLKPQRNEDGTVDYHNLNIISSVFEGDLLARLIPANFGEPGKDVMGKMIPTRGVKPAHFSYGKDIRLSDDGNELYSEITGHVTLSSGKILVSAVYDIPHDVDNSTGNINFDGNVHVKGSVRSGFSIHARGDVVIDGVVEGAFIQADGQIVIQQGIQGMQKAILDARGNVIASFIESARVFAGGYVESGSILYSEVNAAEDVNVLDKKGVIVGGVVRAGGKIEAMTVGTEMEAATKLEVGMAPEKKERYTQLKRSIDAMVKKINKLSPIIKTYKDFLDSGKQLDEKNIGYLRKLVAELEQTKGMLQEARAEFNSLHQELINSKHSKVVVRKEIYPRVEIIISDLTMITKTKRSYCQFEKRNGEIIVSNI